MSYEFINSNGTIIVDTSETKNEVQQEYRDIFGDDLIVDDSSPEGVIINAEVEQRDNLMRNNADLANQINPNLAEGIFLDAIWALTGGQRSEGRKTTFDTPVNLTGQAGTIIPEGVIAKANPSGVEFASTAEVTLDGSGNGSVLFESVEEGEFQVAIGQLDQIVTTVLGWETVSNPAAAIPGTTEESDQQSRNRRKETLGLQGVSLSEAVFSAVRAVEGVNSLSFFDNRTNAVVVVEGVNVDPKTIYTCVDGGSDSAVALALLNASSTDFSGDLTVNTTDSVSGQTYPVKFSRPDIIQTEIVVTASAGSSVVDPETAIKTAIIDYANGDLNGFLGFTVGRDASPFEIAAAINAENIGIFVSNVEIDVQGGTPVPATLDILIDQQAAIEEANISVSIV